MNWINNVVRPKIQGILRKREVPDNLWVKCPETGQMVFHKDLEANQYVVPGSGYHMRMSANARLASLFDEGEYETLPAPEVPLDPLKFRDERRYTDRLKDAKHKTSMEDAVLVGQGRLEGLKVTAAVQDFNFMGGSLGMAAGEAIVGGMLTAAAQETPFIMFAASGGARMQEGILSLMQMPRTTVAVQRLRDARLPYIVVLTHPTTGGVTASYAMLGDIHLAEPGALIGFAGPRVIEQTIREQLPDGFQRSEYLQEHGMVDMVVHRHELRNTLSKLCHVLIKKPVEHADSLVGEDGEAVSALQETDQEIGDAQISAPSSAETPSENSANSATDEAATGEENAAVDHVTEAALNSPEESSAETPAKSTS